uniref:ANK_REP_REGION domain-containing protein n=1 Tax=Macrostomum lignano TaxID=282301 RepID=A0A1I8HJL3_9PLAT
MAVMNKDLELVKLLVKCGAVIDQRAVGDFFRPEDQRQVNKAAITDYRGQSYLGEYPLAFACCVGSAEIYDFLLSCGAHPDSKDQFGNSVLHMLVIHNNTEIYRLAVKHHKKPANPKLTNSAGLNPISLAAKLGRKDVFNEIIDLSSSEMWRFANITCKVYPLTGVDTIGQSGRTDWNSAFMYIINGTTDQHLDMLEQGLINQLLYEKWQKYARARFLQRLLMLTIHIIIMSAAIYLRPLKSSSDTSATSSSLESDNSSLTTTASSVASTTTAAAAAVTISTQEVFRYVFECITVVNSLVTLFMHIDEVREQGVLDFLRGLFYGVDHGSTGIRSVPVVLGAKAPGAKAQVLKGAKAQVLKPQVLKPQVLKPQVLKPQVLKPQVLKPQVLKPQVLKPQVLKPQVLKPKAPVLKPQVLKPQVLKPQVLKPQLKPQVLKPQVLKPQVLKPSPGAKAPGAKAPGAKAPGAKAPVAKAPVAKAQVLKPQVLKPQVLKSQGDAPPKTSFLIACLLISLALPVRIMSLLWTSNLETLTNAEETLLIIAA